MRSIIKKIIPNWMKEKRRQLLRWGEIIKSLKYVLFTGTDIGYIFLPVFSEDVKDWWNFDGKYHSQMMQDYYLDTFVFRRKENGFFCDVGGNNPIFINNTYFFEKERNWNGIAIEPMPKMNLKWKDCRNVECLQCALGKEEGSAIFCEYDRDYMSGLAANVDYNGDVISKYDVKILTLKKIFEEKKICHIDFMSIDVEGSELDVLQGIDFSKVSISVIVVENNKGRKKEKEIRDFLFQQGYYLQARLWIDDIWVKASEE